MNCIPPVALLAGGLATRLLPLTAKVPKSLLQVAGEPFICHQLRMLRRNGITRVVLCLGHMADQIQSLVGTGEQFDLHLDYSIDGPSPLGTGGALRAALDLLGDEFFVMYGDSWLDIQYEKIVKSFHNSHFPALMTIFRNEGKWDRSNVWFEDGRIRLYDKRTHQHEMHYIDWGLAILRAEVIADWPADKTFDLADVYSALSLNGQLMGFEVDQRFYEIGSVKGLEETDRLLRQQIQSLYPAETPSL